MIDVIGAQQLIESIVGVIIGNQEDFFVSAIVYVNEDQILNDDKYETDEVGLPFFAELGEYLYQRDLKRKKQLMPDLSKMKLVY